MKSLKLLGKQIIILLVFSILVSIGSIIHGVYMDLDVSQIKKINRTGNFINIHSNLPRNIILRIYF